MENLECWKSSLCFPFLQWDVRRRSTQWTRWECVEAACRCWAGLGRWFCRAWRWRPFAFEIRSALWYELNRVFYFGSERNASGCYLIRAETPCDDWPQQAWICHILIVLSTNQAMVRTRQSRHRVLLRLPLRSSSIRTKYWVHAIWSWTKKLRKWNGKIDMYSTWRRRTIFIVSWTMSKQKLLWIWYWMVWNVWRSILEE